MDQRENVFTQFARSINAFSQHNINKEQLFERFVDMIEMCSENEKQERSICKKELGEYYSRDLDKKGIINFIPFSFYLPCPLYFFL